MELAVINNFHDRRPHLEGSNSGPRLNALTTRSRIHHIFNQTVFPHKYFHLRFKLRLCNEHIDARCRQGNIKRALLNFFGVEYLDKQTSKLLYSAHVINIISLYSF